MNCICIRCKKELFNTDNKTCDKCIAYVAEKMVCEWCNNIYTRTNRTRHMKSFICRSTNGELALYYKGILNIVEYQYSCLFKLF